MKRRSSCSYLQEQWSTTALAGVALLILSHSTVFVVHAQTPEKTSSGAREAFDYALKKGLIETSDTYDTPAQVTGSAILTIMPGETNVQQSNYNWRSFQLTNTGDKRVAAAFIDVTDAIFSDIVFDGDGTGGDDAYKELNFDWGTTETNPVSPSDYQWEWMPARSDPKFRSERTFDVSDLTNVNNLFVSELADSDQGGASGGFRGELLLFETFVPGETAEFSGDMDANSIAGLKKGTIDKDANWDLGGVSGAEMIGSVVSILYGDGSIGTGTIASDGSQAGSIAVIRSDLEAAPILSVNGMVGGESGSYSRGVPPTVLTSARVGDTVRVSKVTAFDPTANLDTLANGKINVVDLVQARLQAQHPEFPANNAKSWEHVEVVIPASGTIDISDLFSYDTEDLPLGFTAIALENDTPASETTRSIRLTFSNADSSNKKVVAEVFTNTMQPSCPVGRKLDESGYCVKSSCNSNYICPSNYTRKHNRGCYNKLNDCTCNTGFKADDSGYCVSTQCYDNYTCPANSYRKKNRWCYDQINDCRCRSGYRMINKVCQRV